MREPIQIVPTSMLEEAKKGLAEAKKFQAINDELIERSLLLSGENATLKAELAEVKTANEELNSEVERLTEELRETNVLHAGTKQELEEAKLVAVATFLGLV